MWGEKTQKLKLWHNSKTEIVRKIKTQKLKSRPNLNQIATQLKTSSRDKTQGLKFLQLKKLNCDKTQELKLWQNSSSNKK